MKFDSSLLLATLAATSIAAPAPLPHVNQRWVDTTDTQTFPSRAVAAEVRQIVKEKARTKRQLDQILGGLGGAAGGGKAAAGGAGGLGALLGGLGGGKAAAGGAAGGAGGLGALLGKATGGKATGAGAAAGAKTSAAAVSLSAV